MKASWIHEEEAAKKVGYKSHKHFRRLVRERKIPIAYSSVRGRNFQYNEKDIEKLLLTNSTIIND